jgi:undecaprenyl diphosphate synthase
MMQNKKMPRHIAIIMDGNGRWAKQKNMPRVYGHVEGVKRVDEIVAVARRMEIKFLTLFAFSIENWSRPKQEVKMLMKALASNLDKKTGELDKAGIKFKVLGRQAGVPKDLLAILKNAEERTKNNTAMTLCLAFNYGARQEIVDAVQLICKSVKRGKVALEDIDEKMVGEALYTKGIPDPDLLIRTSGEQRISNFLLWQLSYSEFYFTAKCWPDFNQEEFKKAVANYQQRERRYGQI